MKQSLFLSVDLIQQLLLMFLPRCAFVSCIVIVVVEMLRYWVNYTNHYYGGRSISCGRISSGSSSSRSRSSSSSSSSSRSRSRSSSSSGRSRLQQHQTSSNDGDDDSTDINEDKHDDHHHHDDDDDHDDDDHDDDDDDHDDSGSFQLASFQLECLLKILSSVASIVMLLLRPYYAMIFATVMMHGFM